MDTGIMLGKMKKANLRADGEMIGVVEFVYNHMREGLGVYHRGTMWGEIDVIAKAISANALTLIAEGHEQRVNIVDGGDGRVTFYLPDWRPVRAES